MLSDIDLFSREHGITSNVLLQTALPMDPDRMFPGVQKFAKNEVAARYALGVAALGERLGVKYAEAYDARRNLGSGAEGDGGGGWEDGDDDDDEWSGVEEEDRDEDDAAVGGIKSIVVPNVWDTLVESMREPHRTWGHP